VSPPTALFAQKKQRGTLAMNALGCLCLMNSPVLEYWRSYMRLPATKDSFIFCTKVKAFNRRFLLVKIFPQNLVLRPTATATFSVFLTYSSSNNEEIFIQYHWLISSIKKPRPTMTGQEKTKAGEKQEQPWIVQGSTTTNNNNYKPQLFTRTYSSAVSSVGPPLLPCQKGTGGEHQPDPESSTANTAAIFDMVSSVIGK
jgi:hypothetical protein